MEKILTVDDKARPLVDTRVAFCLMVAHELRTPLTSIYGYIKLLLSQEDSLGLEYRELLMTIQENTLRLHKVVNNLTDVANFNIEDVKLRLQPEAPDCLLMTIQRSYQAQLSLKEQTLQIEMSDNLPPVLCDAFRIKQVVCHLLDNASRNSPRGKSITLSADLTADGHYLRISVADIGSDTGPTSHQNLAEQSMPGDELALSEMGEMGLGLYLAHSLVKLHNGFFWSEYRTEQGNVVYIALPLYTDNNSAQVSGSSVTDTAGVQQTADE
jgi:two-component system, OmpR family, sensor histidine kinase BaeS